MLFVPDCHVPYEDGQAFGLMLEAARDFRPDIIVLLGDFADFYAVSSHSKSPDREASLQWEVERVKERLGELADLGASRLVYVCGNHEDRLSRYIAERAPELFGTVSIEEILGLEELGFEFVPYRREIKIGKLNITHDTGNAGPQAHAKTAALFAGNAVIGHTHRLSYAVQGDARGNAHVAAMFGWLGDVDAIDYLHRVQASQWVHGFGVGFMEPSGVVHITPVPIVRGRCVVSGALYPQSNP